MQSMLWNFHFIIKYTINWYWTLVRAIAIFNLCLCMIYFNIDLKRNSRASISHSVQRKLGSTSIEINCELNLWNAIQCGKSLLTFWLCRLSGDSLQRHPSIGKIPKKCVITLVWGGAKLNAEKKTDSHSISFQIV